MGKVRVAPTVQQREQGATGEDQELEYIEEGRRREKMGIVD